MALVGLTLALGIVVDVGQGFFASLEVELPIGISTASSCSSMFSSPSKLARQLDVCCNEALLVSSKCLELFSSLSQPYFPIILGCLLYEHYVNMGLHNKKSSCRLFLHNNNNVFPPRHK